MGGSTVPGLLDVGLGVGEAAIAVQARVAPVHQLLDLEVGHLAPGVGQATLEEGRHLLVVAVRTAHGLAHDLVHQAQGLEAVGRDAQGVGGLLGLFAGLPEDGGTALGRRGAPPDAAIQPFGRGYSGADRFPDLDRKDQHPGLAPE